MTKMENITTYIQSNVAWTFDTVADMKLATNLIDGSYAKTLGFRSLNDGGGAIYYINNNGTANERNVIAIGSLNAHLVINPNNLNVKQFGAYGDGSHDDLTAIQATVDYGRSNGYYNIHIPKGRYNISNALVLPELVQIYGDTRDTSVLVKTTNNTDSTDNVDAVVIFRKTQSYDRSYPERISLSNMAIEGKNDNTYGIYCPSACPRLKLDNINISKINTGFKLYNAWLFNIKDTSIQPVQNGFDIGHESDTSTSLNMVNTYVYGGSGTAYKLRGISYSGLTNICCDANTGIPYEFEWCNLSIDGFGCECEEASHCMKSTQSTLEINNATVLVNYSSSSYKCIEIVNNSRVTANKWRVMDRGENNTTTPGMFLYVGTIGTIVFNDCYIQKPFNTANHYNTTYDNYKVKTQSSDYFDNGNCDICGIGNVKNVGSGTAKTEFNTNANIKDHMGGIMFNNKAQVRYSLDGTDRNWKPAYKYGDLFVNQAPLLNGVAIQQQVSDSETREMAGTISAVSISGTSGTITLSSLDLETYANNLGLKIETQMKVNSSSGGEGTISAINTNDNVLSLTSVTGTFAVGDSLTYTGRTRIGTTKFSNIQSIGYGNTASRPTNPVSGYMYYDTTLNKPIWFKTGTTWVDATGTSV